MLLPTLAEIIHVTVGRSVIAKCLADRDVNREPCLWCLNTFDLQRLLSVSF
jgi:hypothetical protein